MPKSPRYGKQIVKTTRAPVSNSPISQAVRFGNLVFTQGLTPRDPKTGQLVDSEIREASRLVFNNLKAILEEAGTSLDNVLQLRCYIRDFDDDFPIWNEIYLEYFPNNWPARTVVPAALGDGFLLELDAIAGILE
jgi:2-iminobutanoate/2-iminopropanoate deaminase